MTAMKRCDFLVAHATEGRLRLRKTEYSGANLSDAAKAACSLDQVRKVRYADLTGSLIIEHDCEHERDVIDALKERHGIVVGDESDIAPYAPASVKDVVGDLDQAISRISRGEFDLNAVLSATLFGLGLMQCRQGKFLPAGLTLLLQANTYFRPPPVPQGE